MSFIDKLLEFFLPWKRSKWVKWESQNDITTCVECKKLHGKIFATKEVEAIALWPRHQFCRCKLDGMDVLPAGYATQDGLNGADYWLIHNGKLPKNYITKKEAEKLGWKNNKGNLADVTNGKMIGGDIYKNREGKLPQASGRIWYEADINYTSGHRGTERILYSNDGLIFVTYDHYQTFYEIQIKE